MPRIYTVTLTREFEVTLLAESREEAQDALAKCREEDFDDWSDAPWDVQTDDPVKAWKASHKVPSKFKEPDMAVLDGRVVAIEDYQKTHLTYMEDVKQDADETALRLHLVDRNLSLPGM